MSGVKLAAVYGIWPFKLGFCGPQKEKAKTALLKYLQGKETDEEKIKEILKRFEAAFPYYCLIAKANNIRNPFTEKVVKAYWIGNNLLEKVKIADLRKMICEDFSKPGLLPKEIALRKAREIPDNSKPHHSFHVFVIGSITGRVSLEKRLLDLCRISWGKVKSIDKRKIIVEYQPLEGIENLVLGAPIENEILWDKTLTTGIGIGDWVSFHWNHLVQKLKREDIENLKKYTRITLKMLAKMK